jgi:hypothetical protein
VLPVSGWSLLPPITAVHTSGLPGSLPSKPSHRRPGCLPVDNTRSSYRYNPTIIQVVPPTIASYRASYWSAFAVTVRVLTLRIIVFALLTLSASRIAWCAVVVLLLGLIGLERFDIRTIRQNSYVDASVLNKRRTT